MCEYPYIGFIQWDEKQMNSGRMVKAIGAVQWSNLQSVHFIISTNRHENVGLPPPPSVVLAAQLEINHHYRDLRTGYCQNDEDEK